MDFSGWFEAYLGGRWYTFDARHNVPRIGRVLMGYGRDAVDVALTTSFGMPKLVSFTVWSSEASEQEHFEPQGRRVPRAWGRWSRSVRRPGPSWPVSTGDPPSRRGRVTRNSACWRWWACRATNSMALDLAASLGGTGAWRSSAAPT